MTATHDVQAIKSAVDCRDVVRSLWGEPVRSTRKHNQYYSRWRNDGSKSAFHVYADGFKDYGGDGAAGDVFEFVQRERGYSFLESVEYVINLSGGAGLGTSSLPVSEAPIRTTAIDEPPAASWQNAMTAFVDAAHNRLLNTPKVLNYLKNERGLTDATIETYRLGYNPTWTDTGHTDKDGRVNAFPGITMPYEHSGHLYAVRVRTITGTFASAIDRAEQT
ncbi:MAG: hypothetical protein AAFR22_26245, partial [Chloroflexota bacterium]